MSDHQEQKPHDLGAELEAVERVAWLARVLADRLGELRRLMHLAEPDGGVMRIVDLSVKGSTDKSESPPLRFTASGSPVGVGETADTILHAAINGMLREQVPAARQYLHEAIRVMECPE